LFFSIKFNRMDRFDDNYNMAYRSSMHHHYNRRSPDLGRPISPGNMHGRRYGGAMSSMPPTGYDYNMMSQQYRAGPYSDYRDDLAEPNLPPYKRTNQHYNEFSSVSPMPPRYSQPEAPFYDHQTQKKFRRDWSVLESPSTGSYYEHDNRMAPDYDEYGDEYNDDYNRLSRPKNYASSASSSSSYKYDPIANSGGTAGNLLGASMPHSHSMSSYSQPTGMSMINPKSTTNFGMPTAAAAAAQAAQVLFNTMAPIVTSQNKIPPPGSSLSTPFSTAAATVVSNLGIQQTGKVGTYGLNTPFNGMANLPQGGVIAGNGIEMGNISTAGGQIEQNTQPQMMSFKQFLASLGNAEKELTPEMATKRYNDYKNDFRREQIASFFQAHKNEEWFKYRYHPEESAKRRDEQRENIFKRLDIFIALMNNYDKQDGVNELSLDMTNDDDRRRLFKFLDACMIKLEGGIDDDLLILEKIYNEKYLSTASNQIHKEEKLVLKTTNGSREQGADHKNEDTRLSDNESGMGSSDNSDEDDIGENGSKEVSLDGQIEKETSSKFERQQNGKKKKKKRNQTEQEKKESADYKDSKQQNKEPNSDTNEPVNLLSEENLNLEVKIDPDEKLEVISAKETQNSNINKDTLIDSNTTIKIEIKLTQASGKLNNLPYFYSLLIINRN
jgi:hypothetical protein